MPWSPTLSMAWFPWAKKKFLRRSFSGARAFLLRRWARMLGVPVDKAGRVIVQPDLTVPGHPEVFVTGDLASATRHNGQPVPGVAPAAIQMGKFAARQIKRSVAGKPREKFEYLDKGSLATIGRSRAVADFGKVHISGLFRVAGMVVHSFAVSCRLPQSAFCAERMGVGLSHLQPQRSARSPIQQRKSRRRSQKLKLDSMREACCSNSRQRH